LLPPAVLVATIACVAWRITRGVDLSDESYYAVFLHAWFKEGAAASPFLMLHQTSVLIVYPAALLYRALVGSTLGLILFLRCLYLLGSVIAALATMQFLRNAGVGRLRFIAGALIVAFVPYNLPAPSYNTMGAQALIIACATFGSAVLGTPRWERPTLLLCLSAAAWALALVAYPPLLLPLVALLVLMVVALRPRRAITATYLLAIAVAQGTAWALVFGILGVRRVASSMEFQGKLSSTFDARATPGRLAEILTSNRGFAVVLVLAVLLGLLRKKIPFVVAALADAALVVSLLFLPPALWGVSHGAVLVAAVGGLWLIGGVRPGSELTAKVLSSLYVVSWLAGLCMAGTATIGTFKVPVGATLAAVIAVCAASRWWGESRPSRFVPLAATALWVTLMICLWHPYYGEPPATRPVGRIRITGGPFAGLAASRDDAGLVRSAGQALDKYERPGDTIAVAGRMPGLYLLSHARVRTLVPYPFTPYAQPFARAATHDYYANPANRPNLVLIYRDPVLPVANPFDPDFETWYRPKARFPTPLGFLEVYRRADEPR
jgi:hypothetical protein